MTIKMVKLVTGEDLLADVTEEENKITLKEPMALIMQGQGLQMVPWLMLAKVQEVTFDRSKTVLTYEPKDELVSAYQQQTGHIVTAPANVLDTKGKLVV